MGANAIIAAALKQIRWNEFSSHYLLYNQSKMFGKLLPTTMKKNYGELISTITLKIMTAKRNQNLSVLSLAPMVNMFAVS